MLSQSGKGPVLRRPLSCMNPSLRPLFGLAGYMVLLPLAWWQEWQPGELAWGLWISGLAMIAVWLLVMSALLVIETDFVPLKMGGILVGMGAFACGLGWIYAFYGELLDLGFPLTPDPSREFIGGTTWRNVRPFEFWPAVGAATRLYYFVIALALLPLITGLQRGRWQADKFRHAPEFSGASFVRLHFTVLALIGLQIAFQGEPSQNTFWFSAAILTINFFPWELLDKRKIAELSAPSLLPRSGDY